MSSSLSSEHLAQLVPLLGSLADLVADGSQLHERELRALLLGVALESNATALEELRRWGTLLHDLRQTPDEPQRRATVAALRLCGVPEATAILAVVTVVGSGASGLSPQTRTPVLACSPIASSVASPRLHASMTNLDFGVLRPHQTTTLELDVQGGPGQVVVENDHVQVAPMQFGAGTTHLRVGVKPLASGLLFTSLKLVTAGETLEVPIVAQWQDGGAVPAQLVLDLIVVSPSPPRPISPRSSPPPHIAPIPSTAPASGLKHKLRELWQSIARSTTPLPPPDSPPLLTSPPPPAPDLAAMWETIQALHASSIMTGDIQGSGVAIGAGAQATVQTIYVEPRYPRYTDITCPRRVALDERVTITVALTMRQQPDSVTQQAGGFFASKVKVRLVAPGFDLLNALEPTIVIDADEESPPVVFHLRPRDVGRHAIAVEFWQRGNLIVRAEAPIEVLAVPPPSVESALFVSTGIDLRLSAVRPPDLTLIVFRDDAGRTQYTLHRDGAVIFRTETTLPTAPHALMAQLYTEAHLSPTNEPGALDREQMERRLTTLGYILWDRLIPADLKRFYERERTQWQVVADGARRWSLLVQSNEADIPWELLRPYASGEAPWAEECWCRTFFFARWLLGAPNTGEYFAPLPNVSLANLATILPTTYPNLSTIAEERALFQHLISQYGWNDCSPQATETAVLARLATGGYTWLHATTPGDRFATTPPQPSALGLDHQQSLPYRMITGPQIRNALRSQRPAIVLTACHAEATGMPFSDLAGWATQLIGAGAGLFLAPHWSVDTECATIFSRTFYTTLLNRERPATSAEAVWYAREAIRRTGDPMWLAYRLFAHPNAVGWSA